MGKNTKQKNPPLLFVLKPIDIDGKNVKDVCDYLLKDLTEIVKFSKGNY